MSEVIHKKAMDRGDGRKVQAHIELKLWTDGAMSVEGHIDDEAFAIAMLENALATIRNHHARKSAQGLNIIVPGKDVSIAEPLHPLHKP